MNPRDAKSNRMLAQVEGGGWAVNDFAPDMSWAIVSQYVSVEKADLFRLDMATGALNATWPIGSNAIALDETGAEVPSSPTTHDILTGSTEAGMAVANSTCMDWTSSATTVKGTVGHSNRNGGGRPPSWNSAHESGGCGDISGTRNVSVGSGGGRGSIYCFALP